MKKLKYFVFGLICLLNYGIVYAENEVIIKSITPIYDETSTVVVTEEQNIHSVIFNDKEQSVEYKIVLENTTDKDLSVENIELSAPSEDFLLYGLEGLDSNDIIEANSTKEIVISLETIKKDGWGRNFKDELIANISFDTSALNSNIDVFNPDTSDFILLVFLVIISSIVSFIFLKKYKFARYWILIITFFTFVPCIKADFKFIVPVEIKASYESQNVMKSNSCNVEGLHSRLNGCDDYWNYNQKIKNIYIINEMKDVSEYAYKFDVTEKQNAKVMAYLFSNDEDPNYYDLYLQADGIIYANEDASFYFADMTYLDSINNLEGFDTSNVADMSYMFYFTGCHSSKLVLDLSTFNTENVTDMKHMFHSTGCNNINFLLSVNNFDTSKVTDMKYMFYNTGYSNQNFTLDVNNFDTSNVIDMSYMFQWTGMHSKNLNIVITIKNKNMSEYTDVFYNVAIEGNSKVTVNYTNETSELVDKMIATKPSISNVVKGIQID